VVAYNLVRIRKDSGDNGISLEYDDSMMIPTYDDTNATSRRGTSRFALGFVCSNPAIRPHI
jgi:hypothetical protein